ncbi:hypothetical protein [Falsirhodobacter sp. 20TX0035]|uniref:hypothetical protein n=1 Tax=Falsirhodobacter sp. 20TX0035 TaxID=3022019 RepID=UPI00232CADA5|nr:hypothetical protein [Falsirhodobacter sp. 20TX0035]MDB6454478.1 hypothetical protein [Falsirhodobacter sp. 20TX0035]
MTTMTMDGAMAGLIDLGEEYGLRAISQRVVQAAWQGALNTLGVHADRVRFARDEEDQRRAGRDRMAEEALRVRGRLILARPPEEMAAAAVAPARGPMRLVDSVEVAEDLRLSDLGEWQVLSRVDGQWWEGVCQLTAMVMVAKRAWRKKVGSLDGFVAPFTPGQIQMGQRYATLVERHNAGGMKGSSFEARMDGGGGQGGGFIDVFVAEGRELDLIHRRIGTGQAMAVRRVRPSARGTKSGITDRRLVDMVVLGGMDLTAVLRAHGWLSESKHRTSLRESLAAALDRMQGYAR